MNVGFLGFGNMASAMAKGLIKTGSVKPEQIFACAKNWDKLCQTAGALGVVPCKSAAEVAEQAELIVIAVKPYLVEEVITPIGALVKDKIVVSVAVGCWYETLSQWLPEGAAHLSTLPNTPVAVGEGIIVCENQHTLSAEQLEQVKTVFSPMALLEFVDSKQISVAGTLAGCGPAFASMFVEALADGAVKHGLPRAQAYRLASQMMVGTGKLQIATGEHPAAMKDAVCSPGGTTIVGISKLEEKGFRSAVISAIDAIEN